MYLNLRVLRVIETDLNAKQLRSVSIEFSAVGEIAGRERE